ncbi:hypothetical protein HZ994_14880 [Akkermansiaceae bacterium]|nr:hypothetical protein HZ994_14880 [Akkermansiaceae bacterium]
MFFFPVTILRNLIAVLLLLLMQGPAIFLQEVAWLNMVVSYSQESGFKRGVIKTFDGEHPCSLCKKVAKLRQQKEDDSSVPPAPKVFRPSLAWDAMVVSAGRLRAPLPKYEDYLAVTDDWQRFRGGKGTDGPEVPPPELS